MLRSQNCLHWKISNPVIDDLNSQIQELNEQAAEKEAEIADLQTQLNTAKASSVKIVLLQLLPKKAVLLHQPRFPVQQLCGVCSQYQLYGIHHQDRGKVSRDSCRYLKKSQIAIDKDDAVAQGYTPCSVCNP